MKVLHINTNYTQSALHQTLINALDNLNENAVFVPTCDKNRTVSEVGKNVVISECFHKYDRILFCYKQRKILRAVEDAYCVSNYDLIHAYTLFTDGNVAYNLHRKYNIPYVVAVRNTDVNAFFKYRPHLRGRGVKILRNAAAVFFLSDSYRKQVIDHYVPKNYREEISKKMHIIPNGIDPYWFMRGECHRKPEGKRLKMVFAGNIDRNKNITTAADACKLLRDRGYDASLTVIGNVVVSEVAKELASMPHVTLLPRKTKEELAQIYSQQDVFVMPSFYESFGLVYAEAMSQGLPVIYSRGQGFDGQFPEGTVGYSVKSSDATEIAYRIEKILGQYEPMSQRCIDLSKKFRWEAFASTYYDIYKEFAE